MIALPSGFLPFDPNRDDDGNENEDDEFTPESDDESIEDLLDNPTSNGESNHTLKKNRHIGGGVILVSIEAFRIDMLIIGSRRVQQVNVFSLQC
jgi:hypothetical protein